MLETQKIGFTAENAELAEMVEKKSMHFSAVSVISAVKMVFKECF